MLAYKRNKEKLDFTYCLNDNINGIFTESKLLCSNKWFPEIYNLDNREVVGYLDFKFIQKNISKNNGIEFLPN